MSNLKYQANVAYLHTDETLLPESQKVWSAWNYISETDQLSKRAVGVSYLINKLQPLPFKEQIIVTLNPSHKPAADKTIKVINYEHPVFDQAAIEAQKKIHLIQDSKNTVFAGAYCGYGFHEDGLKAGVEVAKLLGVKVPW